ncbi:hypothetical protein D3870_21375 [Noviherbaspirillum cavernae]|uniref:Uncharacterized protein n=1 Tax=Noviherbaspirillum cavernae TaxID=2320862 RepID=A0A418WWK7_9BURK|nr:hypothetical protein [Noviherbaspirillum cavernae]RJF96921.1 hypothetical protein D3870_21375 [Noviherbaspirillum cavernae]
MNEKSPSTNAQKIFINSVDKTEELQSFAEAMGLNRTIPGRYSSLFLVDLFAHMEIFGVNPFKIMHEVEALEGCGRASSTKPPSLFDKLPLRGLWHKHYLGTGVPGLVQNIRNGLGKEGLEKLIIAELSGGEITPEMMNKFTHELVHGTYIRRAEDNKLTGEWIIFAKHNGENFYLCLGGHTWGDEYIAARIRELCVPEFPFLFEDHKPA